MTDCKETALDLGPHQIQSVPPEMYYIPDFISAEEEQYISQKIPANRWVSLSHRRLQAVPTQLTANNVLLASPLPDWLARPVLDRLARLRLFADAPHGVNHCLINEYLPGQGIMPHEDGDAYHPVVATVSLSGTVVLDVTERRTKADGIDVTDRDQSHSKCWRIVQEPRSLLVTTGSAYGDTLHGIPDVEEDVDLSASTVANWSLLGDCPLIEANGGRNKRETRISLTYRDVRRVSSLGGKIFGRGRS